MRIPPISYTAVMKKRQLIKILAKMSSIVENDSGRMFERHYGHIDINSSKPELLTAIKRLDSIIKMKGLNDPWKS